MRTLQYLAFIGELEAKSGEKDRRSEERWPQYFSLWLDLKRMLTLCHITNDSSFCLALSLWEPFHSGLIYQAARGRRAPEGSACRPSCSRRGVRSSPVLARNPPRRPGRYCILLSLAQQPRPRVPASGPCRRLAVPRPAHRCRRPSTWVASPLDAHRGQPGLHRLALTS